MNALKPYACGVVNHPLIDAMIALRGEEGVAPENVENIAARVHPLVLELVNRQHPKIGLEGKFSFQHSMAVGLVDGAATPEQYTDRRVADPVIVSLRDRISATVDNAMAEDATEVTLTLRNGKSYTQAIAHATGAPQNPMTDDQLNAKFQTLARDGLSKRRVSGLLESLWRLEDAPDIRPVLALTRMRRRKVRS